MGDLSNDSVIVNIPGTPIYFQFGETKGVVPSASGTFRGLNLTNDTKKVAIAKQSDREPINEQEKGEGKTEVARQTWNDWLDTATSAAPLRGLCFVANYLSEGLREIANKVYNFICCCSFSPLKEKEDTSPSMELTLSIKKENTNPLIEAIPESIRKEINNNKNLTQEVKDLLLISIAKIPSYLESLKATDKIEEKLAEFKSNLERFLKPVQEQDGTERSGPKNQYQRDGERDVPMCLRDGQYEYKTRKAPGYANPTIKVALMQLRLKAGEQAIEKITERPEDKKWEDALYAINTQVNANSLFGLLTQEFKTGIAMSDPPIAWQEDDGIYSLSANIQTSQPTITSTIQRDEQGNIKQILVEVEGGLPILKTRQEPVDREGNRIKGTVKPDEILISNVITGRLSYTVTLSPDNQPLINNFSATLTPRLH